MTDSTRPTMRGSESLLKGETRATQKMSVHSTRSFQPVEDRLVKIGQVDRGGDGAETWAVVHISNRICILFSNVVPKEAIIRLYIQYFVSIFAAHF